VIIELDGKKILGPAEFPRMITFGHIGKTVTFKAGRQRKAMKVKVLSNRVMRRAEF
jgi:S1-C subfamily serine protease